MDRTASGTTGSLPPMPVLLTAAHRLLPRRIAQRLLMEGGEVRAYGHGELAGLRAAGAFVAHGTPDDEGRLEAAMIDVHTVVHAVGGLLGADPDALLAEASAALTAAANAEVRRVIVISIAGADEAAADPVRRVAARVESLAAAAAPPSIVIRTSLVDTPATRDALATADLAPEDLTRTVAPVRLEDLVEVVVGFDRARSTARSGHLLVAVDGPARLSVAGYLDRVGAGRPGSGALVGRRLADLAGASRLAAVLAGRWWTDDAVVVDGWSFAGLEPGAPGPGSAG